MEIRAIMIGNELLSGLVQDLNSRYMGGELKGSGYRLTEVRFLGDDHPALVKFFREAEALGGIYVVSGGLGPTADDLTRQAAAEAFGLQLELDRPTLDALTARFAGRGIVMSASNEIQAWFPQGAEVLANPVGTAAGFAIRRDRAVFIFLPGVPREFKVMFNDTVLPFIKSVSPPQERIFSRRLRIFGMSESRIGELVSGALPPQAGLTVAYLPEFPEVMVVLTASSADPAQAQGLLDAAEKKVCSLLKDKIFSADGASLEETVGRLLKEKGLKLAVAESCTGGGIASLLTDVPGSSDYFSGGAVVYSNDFKEILLKVPHALLLSHGAVSEEAALAMAQGVKSLNDSDFGIAVTGIAGPDGGSPEKPVGTVYIALSFPEGEYCRRYNFIWDRRFNRLLSTFTALDMLRRKLCGFNLDPFG